MPQLEVLRNRVASILGVGNTIDSEIEEAIRDQIREFESTIDLRYMERFQTFTLPIAQRFYPAPERMKKVKWIRWSRPQEYIWVRIQSGWEETAPTLEGIPTAVWFDNKQQFWYDKIPTENLAGEILYYVYSEETPPDDSPLWSSYRKHMLYGTLASVGIVARKPEIVQIYGPMYEQLMVKLQTVAEQEGEEQQSLSMQYVPMAMSVEISNG